MKILIACEFSQIVTKAFRNKGHKAFSCDIEPTEGNPDWHIQDDVLNHLNDGWDMMIAFPPCTYLSFAANRVWNNSSRVYKRLDALKFFADLWEAPIEKICIENPKGCASPTIAKYSQIIQPYYFGDRHIKTTCLWLKNLSKLQYDMEDGLFGKKTATSKPEPIYISQGKKTKGKKEYYTTMGHFSDYAIKDRSKERGRTFNSIAQAMADQWG